MKDKSVALSGEQAELTLGPVAMSINGADRSEINDFKGRSQTRRLPDGRIEIAVQESPRRGKGNEPQVRKVLQEALSRERGVDVTIRAPTEDEDRRGIDGIVLAPDGTLLIVQIVTVPTEKDYGRCVSQGSHRVVLTVDGAIDWIAGAIEHKGKIAPADRGSMILALDVRHAGLLAAEDVVAATKQRICPEDLGFAAIWLVANVSTHSARLA